MKVQDRLDLFDRQVWEQLGLGLYYQTDEKVGAHLPDKFIIQVRNHLYGQLLRQADQFDEGFENQQFQDQLPNELYWLLYWRLKELIK